MKPYLKLEHRHEPFLPRAAFIRRLARYGVIAGAMILASLGIGVLGYHFFAGLAWIDALVNASMLLGGMGPVNELNTVPGKLFAAFYSLYSGIVFLIIVGVLFAPIFHRALHHFHLDLDEEK